MITSSQVCLFSRLFGVWGYEAGGLPPWNNELSPAQSRNVIVGGTWMALFTERGTLDLGVVSSSTMLGVAIT